LIWLNVFLACTTMLSLLSMVLLQLLGSFGGDWLAIPTMFALLLVYFVEQMGYVLCCIAFFSAAVLLVIPGIPWKVKAVLGTVEAGTGALLIWLVHTLRMHPPHF
jgi:hypothetical protein